MISVQVNLAAETGDMGVLANHVPSIEQLKPGLVEVIEEGGGSKQFFCMELTSSLEVSTGG
jgi:F-type H+-transporting ATPase subunit delta